MLVRIGLALAVTALAIGRPALAQGARYQIFPEPQIRQASNHRVTSAYVVDKRANQFWVCTVRYNFSADEANSGECVVLPANIGRPSLNENFQAEAITGSVPYGPFLPVVWFIEPGRGEVQFCALRHAGVCVHMTLP
jgi:hypothetical protein